MDASLLLGRRPEVLEIPASVYVPVMTGFDVDPIGQVHCTFCRPQKLADKQIQCFGTRWACLRCPAYPPDPWTGRLGSNIDTLAALVFGVQLPVDADWFGRVRDVTWDLFFGDIVEKRREREAAGRA